MRPTTSSLPRGGFGMIAQRISQRVASTAQSIAKRKRQRTKLAATAFIYFLSTGAYAQIDCTPLKPTPPQDITVDATGKIDASLRKFIKLEGSIEGSYREAAKDVLKDYPKAERLFLWSRMLYLYCETIKTSKMTDAEKINKLDDILKRVDAPPPKSSVEPLLDPPVLQFGMSREQVRALLRARRPSSYSESNLIAALQAAGAGRSLAATPGGSPQVMQANATLLGLQGEAVYGFDGDNRLSWVSVWNVCARERSEFPPGQQAHSSWLQWSRYKDIGNNDDVDCDRIFEVRRNLASTYGGPISTAPRLKSSYATPGDSEICQDLFRSGFATCFEYRTSLDNESATFLAKDRQTPIEFRTKTLAYSAKLDKREGNWQRLIRERIAAVLTISSADSPDPVEPVIKGIFFRYLN